MIIQAIINSYNLFAEPLLLTNGGPSDSLYVQPGLRKLERRLRKRNCLYNDHAFIDLSILNVKLFGGFG